MAENSYSSNTRFEANRRSLSSWNISIQSRYDFSDKRQHALLRGVGGLAGVHGSGDAHQGAVAAVHCDRIFDQVVLGPVLAGHTAIMRPEPVEHEPPSVSLLDEIAICGKGLVTGY